MFYLKEHTVLKFPTAIPAYIQSSLSHNKRLLLLQSKVSAQTCREMKTSYNNEYLLLL